MAENSEIGELSHPGHRDSPTAEQDQAQVFAGDAYYYSPGADALDYYTGYAQYYGAPGTEFYYNNETEPYYQVYEQEDGINFEVDGAAMYYGEELEDLDEAEPEQWAEQTWTEDYWKNNEQQPNIEEKTTSEKKKEMEPPRLPVEKARGRRKFRKLLNESRGETRKGSSPRTPILVTNEVYSPHPDCLTAMPVRTRNGYRQPIMLPRCVDVAKNGPTVVYNPSGREWIVFWLGSAKQAEEEGESSNGPDIPLYRVFQAKKHGKLRARELAENCLQILKDNL